MDDVTRTTRFHFWLWLIRVIGVIVPRRLRADWRQEWEAELHYRETLLTQWDRLDRSAKLALLWHSLGAFADALWMQPRRMEDEMFQDLRYGARMLVKSPNVTLIAIITLALGIGANTAIFSLVNAVLLRPLPAPHPEQLVTLNRGNGLGDPLSHPDFLALRERNEVLSGLAAYTLTELSFGDGGRGEMVVGELVSGNYFETLGVRPALGRAFLPEEDRVPGERPVVVISHNFWRSRFDADPGVIGRTVTLNNHRFTVVGVAPAGFTGMNAPFAIEIWAPLMMIAQAMTDFAPSLDQRRDESFAAVGRLKPGVSLTQAQTQLEAINRQLELANPLSAGGQPNANADRSLKLARPQGVFIPYFRGMAVTATRLLAAVVGIVLLIACANVANMLLARASARRKEIAIRLAMGAGRWRLVRQLLTESALLALLGAGAGALLAFWINQALMAFEPPLPASWNFQVDLRLDAPALAFTLLLALVTAALFGLAPALRASKPDLIPALKDETGAEISRGRRLRWLNLRGALVIAQMAVSLTLLVSAGLFIRSLQNMQRIDLGFQPENRLTLSLNLRKQGYDDANGKEFVNRAVARIAALPGVEAASVANFLPLGFMGFAAPVALEGREPPPGEPPLRAENQIIGLDYFRAMGMRLARGRDFTARDTASAPRVVIINETMARRLFPDADPLGKRLRVGPPNAPLCEVVGVARDVAFRLGEEPSPAVYRPYAQRPSQWVTLIAHITGDPHALIAGLRREMQSLDDNLPLQEIKTLEEIVAFSLWPARMGAALLGIFGLLGLLLAAVGIYGVMAYTVAQRTREIGVRMALGARTGVVHWMIVRQGMTLALVGATAGLALAFAVTRLLASLLYGVSVTDPLTFAGVALFLIGVALLACYFPARRATKVDPMIALRRE